MGLGILALETVQYGAPVAASDIEVFREVGGDAIYYFNQNDIKDISGALTEILNNALLKKELISKSKKVISKYNWDDIASDLLAKMLD